ncbi:MAG: aldehyde ferredoxin oxidoreductase [Deltaproteobacteria bacterium]|nr:aldehyde ferredoxin oxidoreductase [Deltaproteobacteria bacterium]
MRYRLNVQLDQQHIEKNELPEEVAWLGGRAMIDWIMAREVPPTCHPLGPQNRLILAPGLFAGTVIPSASRLSIGGKSPLTGGIKESNVGGMAGILLGQFGIGALVISGISTAPVPQVLVIGSDSAELVDGRGLQGKGNYETVEVLKKRFGENKVFLTIGPCGEMKMSAATIAVTDTEGRPCRHAGRGGLGAVMGSRGLKAIVLDPEGAKVRKPIDGESFSKALKEYIQAIESSKRTAFWRENGTAGLIDVSHARGSLPTRNFTRGSYEKKDGINAARMKELVADRGGRMGHACMRGCIIRCSNVYNDEKGGYLTSGLEYETLVLMGSNLDIDDLDTIAMIDRRCDDYGIDTIEIGATLGILTETDLFSFGDGRRALDLIDEIGGGTYLGRILGQGACVTGKAFGISRIPAVKGQSLPGHSARPLKGLGVTYATSPQGADHTAGFVSEEPFSNKGHTTRSKEAQINVTLADSLGLCQFTGLRAEYTLFSGLIGSLTGKVPGENEVKEIGRKALWREKEFNTRAGFGPGQDRLPDFMKWEPLSPSGEVFDVDDEDLDRVFGEF